MTAQYLLIDAQRDLGNSYYMGEGVRQNSEIAGYWYRKDAAQRDTKANYNLGLCYMEGEGVRKSKHWARHYFAKATALGHKLASRKLTELS